MVGKKKRNHPDVEELLARPWCYYCERDFDDLKILISHQKAKHFKCERCGRRLNTAGGLSVHMNQVHKETLTSVDHSLPNRQGLEVEIFGMEGIPEDVVQAHNQRIIAGFYQAEAERRAATGNPGPGGAGSQGGQPKKPKFESPSDLKKRLAEHKARKAEQAAAGGGSSGANTPGADQNSPMGQSPATFHATPFPAQGNFNGSQGAGYGSFSQEPYAQPAVAYQQPFTQQQQPPFSGPPGAQYQPQYSPPQQYASTQSFPPSFPAAQQFPGAPPNTYGTYQGPPSHEPVHPGGLPNRPPSLPPAPGLPQRPSFATPTVPTYQMQQLHQGPPHQAGWNGNGWKCQDQKPAMSSAYPPHSQSFNGDHSANAASVDDLVSGAAREADDIDAIIRMAEAGIKPPKKVDGQDSTLGTDAIGPASNSVRTPESTRNEVTDRPEQAEKKTKKDKPIKMIYSDNELSPEERMAMMPRYAFVPDGKTESSLADIAALSGVAGTFGS